MATWKDIQRGYAGAKLSHKDWIFVLRDDARILRDQGQHMASRMLLVLAAQHASAVIGAGC